MKCLLICLAAGSTLVAATPASAQLWFEGGPVGLHLAPAVRQRVSGRSVGKEGAFTHGNLQVGGGTKRM